MSQEPIIHSPSKLLYAEIIIPLALPTTYTWAIPTPLAHTITQGIRVEVQLRNKKYAGIVKRIFTEKPEQYEPKSIINVLDDTPILYDKQLQLWKWMAAYYICSEGEVMQAALPTNLKLSSESVLIWNEARPITEEVLSDEEYIVAEALEVRKELRISEVQQLLGGNRVYVVIKKLVEKDICYVWEELNEKYKPKTETYIQLHPTYSNDDSLSELVNNWSKAPKQMELLMAYLHLLKTEGMVAKSELLKKSGATAAQLNGLIEKGILVSEKKVVNRIKQADKGVAISFILSEAQQQALNEIKLAFNNKSVCLLLGVTASGKTELYIQLINEYLKQGKQVLYMLPEIALTAQTIRRLQKHFGNNIVVYHSKFNPNERVEIWNKIKDGSINIVLGARSSMFLPFQQLGLIIIDEEHDPSYKQQDPAPRYHARDTAIYYATLFNAKVLLGSATPSVESYYNSMEGKYGLVNLNQRYGNVTLPTIELIDLKNTDSITKEKIALTLPLITEIQKTLNGKKQAILFQNRRGYAPYMLCDTCGWIPQCKNCAVTLTFHKSKNKLSCHYCGTTYPVINTCAACGNHNFQQKNFGTEKIEELLVEQFPKAKIARMDYDAIRGKNDHDTLIKQFEEGKIDILVGTQMVVKGLDFEHVNLVGIVDADGTLNFNDFRVNERAFQLMEQVSGRAGRKDGIGKVLIQVSNMYHPVLGFLQEHSYANFYNFEITTRKRFNYPPYSRIINLTIKHKEKHIAAQAAEKMGVGLHKNFEKYIAGPLEPSINRIRNKYIYQLFLKLPKQTNLIEHCKREILQQTVLLHQNKMYSAVIVQADIDPV